MKRGRRRATLSGVKTVTCSCGRLITGETGDELLTAVELHIEAEHQNTGEDVEQDPQTITEVER